MPSGTDARSKRPIVGRHLGREPTSNIGCVVLDGRVMPPKAAILTHEALVRTRTGMRGRGQEIHSYGRGSVRCRESRRPGQA